MLSNKEIISAFINGQSAENRNMSTDGNRIWSYSTVIGQKAGSKIIVNSTRYSVSTSKQQSYLRYGISERGIKYVEVFGCPFNVSDLRKYLNR